MLNRYPLWKYLLILVVLVVGLIYSLPNLFPADPAIQVSDAQGNMLDERQINRVEQALNDNDIAIKAVEEGRTLTDPLRETEVFPNMVTQMIAVGEQTGAMDAMLQKIADFYEAEVDAAVKDMLTLLEPVIISFLGVTIGGVVISMYLPMFELIAKMSG